MRLKGIYIPLSLCISLYIPRALSSRLPERLSMHYAVILAYHFRLVKRAYGAKQGDSIYLSIDCQTTSLDTLLQDLQEILSHKGHKDRKDCKTM